MASSSSKAKVGGGYRTKLSYSEPSLLTIILDITPSEWQDRDAYREWKDKENQSKNRPSSGPATFDELLSAVLAFSFSFAASNRENALVVVCVAGDDVAVVWPRKGVELESAVRDPGETVGRKIDARRLHDGLTSGAAELLAASADRSLRRGASRDAPPSPRGAAVAAALSTALCLVNRFAAASGGGVSAARDAERGPGRPGDEDPPPARDDDDDDDEPGRAGGHRRGALSPRVFVVQATPDRASDYNAFMNAAFAASKAGVPIDGCFLKKNNATNSPDTSVFLEQTCDRTNGIYFKPTPNSQINGGLLEIFVTAFLPSVGIRSGLSLPRSQEVNFRARCFQTGESVDTAFVCNLCLSIFKKEPETSCPTCGALNVKAIQKRKRGDEEGH